MSKYKTLGLILLLPIIGLISLLVFTGIMTSDNKVIFSSEDVREEIGWSIDNYNTTIDLKENGDFDVNEKIDVDFKDLDKHGIYRYIPLTFERTYKDRSTETSLLSINNIKVLQDGQKATVEKKKNRKINFLKENSIIKFFDEDLYLRIGEEEKTINGKHIYEISYTVKNGLTHNEQK